MEIDNRATPLRPSEDLQSLLETYYHHKSKMISAGLEPAIPGSVGGCLIHWATRPSDDLSGRREYNRISLESYQVSFSHGIWRIGFLSCASLVLMHDVRGVSVHFGPLVSLRNSGRNSVGKGCASTAYGRGLDPPGWPLARGIDLIHSAQWVSWAPQTGALGVISLPWCAYLEALERIRSRLKLDSELLYWNW